MENIGITPSYDPLLVERGNRTRGEIRRTRHRAELPLYIACSVIGCIGACFMLFYLTEEFDVIGELKKLLESGGFQEGSAGFFELFVLILLAAGFLSGILSVIFMVVMYVISVYSIYAQQLSYSIRVSETNFPEIYAKVREYSQVLGLRKEPEVFVQQMNGELNAFTCWVPGRTFIQMNAEIVDIAYMENKDFDTVFFVMAHEFGHVHLHHVQLLYTIWPNLAMLVPFLGRIILSPLLQRSREYSADRVAQALTGGTSQLRTMMLLSAGRHAYKYVSPADYLREISRKRLPVERFAVWVTNLLASHPIMPYRVAAIMDPEKKSGRLL